MLLENSGIDLGLLNKLHSPCYVYSEHLIEEAYNKLAVMESAFGLEIQYAMKANPNAAILKLLKRLGAKIDASSLNEAIRAQKAGFPLQDITYTTQQITEGAVREQMLRMVSQGMRFTVCSIRQYQVVRELAMKERLKLSIRIHPGKGSGESITRDTGSKYSCFGVHLNDLEGLLERAKQDRVEFDEIHVHIGSGGMKESWLQNVRNQLAFARKWFGELKRINFGGGLKVARMPQELCQQISIKDIELEMKREMLKYGEDTHSKPITVIEPGTFLVANAGFIVTKVTDKKSTGEYNFLLLNGGMELNTRPLLYGSKHPFYIVDQTGKLLSSEWNLKPEHNEFAVVGRCCESGDSQSLHEDTKCILLRRMHEPAIGDFVLIGGTGAYCSSMSPFNYNSHIQAPEYLFTSKGEVVLIRQPQTLEQILQNETCQPLSL